MRIKTNAGYIFDQLESLLLKLTDEQYCLPLDVFSGASVGKHYRHIIEFFQCVGLSNDTETICYDNRVRDIRIEKSREVAVDLLKDLKLDLSEIDSAKKLVMIGDVGALDNQYNSYVDTTLFREFHYAVEHAIHHMAIIKMGVKLDFSDVSVPEEFGVAPSTLRYQQTLVYSA